MHTCVCDGILFVPGKLTVLVLLSVCTVPARLVVCDMVVGSVEHIIKSSWLLRLLERLRVLSLVVQRRQLSYNVVTQVTNNNSHVV